MISGFPYMNPHIKAIGWLNINILRVDIRVDRRRCPLSCTSRTKGSGRRPARCSHREGIPRQGEVPLTPVIPGRPWPGLGKAFLWVGYLGLLASDIVSDASGVGSRCRRLFFIHEKKPRARPPWLACWAILGVFKGSKIEAKLHN